MAWGWGCFRAVRVEATSYGWDVSAIGGPILIVAPALGRPLIISLGWRPQMALHGPTICKTAGIDFCIHAVHWQCRGRINWLTGLCSC